MSCRMGSMWLFTENPAMRQSPVVGASAPVIMRITVVLPAPARTTNNRV